MGPLTRWRNRARFDVSRTAYAPWAPTGPTLDLVFDQNVYYEYEYGPLDPSLNLDFVNQSYGSE